MTTVSRRNTKQLKTETSLYLDGEDLQLKEIQINGENWSNYEKLDAGLLIHQLPEEFELRIITTSLTDNTALEGLYKSGGAFCTQCEAEAL